MELELNHEQAFSFAAVAAMSLVSMVTGRQNENELEEIYIQIHQSDRLSSETEFSLEALDELKDRLLINYHDAHEAILSDLVTLQLEHEESVAIINMALDVVKSNKEIPTEKIDVLTGLCKALNIYSDEFNFVT